eukprot:1181530-Prorocentrum_minimum.AAC.2
MVVGVAFGNSNRGYIVPRLSLFCVNGRRVCNQREREILPRGTHPYTHGIPAAAFANPDTSWPDPLTTSVAYRVVVVASHHGEALPIAAEGECHQPSRRRLKGEGLHGARRRVARVPNAHVGGAPDRRHLRGPARSAGLGL